MTTVEWPGDIPTREDLLEAKDRIRGKVHHTPLFTSTQLDDMFSARLYFKAENLQKAGAFKSRGAVNAVFALTAEQAQQGVCTHSSGNHAQALARAAALRNIPAYIVMPETAPRPKVDAVRAYGGQITFCKPTLSARESTLKTVIQKTGAREIHPYNDPLVIAGQSTVAQEIKLQLAEEPDMIITPVGGGGLLSGTALAVKYFFQHTKVLAAEPRGADDAYRSFYSGQLVPSVQPQTIADGLLTSLGSRTFPVIFHEVSDIMTASDAFIIKAMRFIWERMKLIVEPSAAVPLAALMQQQPDIKGKRIVVVLSGGNLDLTHLPWQKS